MVEKTYNAGESIKSGFSTIGSSIGGALGTALTATVPVAAYKLGEIAETTSLLSPEIIGTTVNLAGNTVNTALNRTAENVAERGSYITNDYIENILVEGGTMTAEAAKTAGKRLADIPPESRLEIAKEYGGMGIDFLTTGTRGAALTYKLPVLINLVGQGIVLNVLHKIPDLIAGTSSRVKDAAKRGGREKGGRGKASGSVVGLAAVLPSTIRHLGRVSGQIGIEFLQFAGKTIDAYRGVGKACRSGFKKCFSGKGGLRGNIKESGNDIKKALKNMYTHDIERKKTGIERIDKVFARGYNKENTETPSSEKKEKKSRRPFGKKKEKKEEASTSVEKKSDEKKKTISDNETKEVIQTEQKKETFPTTKNKEAAIASESKRNELTVSALRSQDMEKKREKLQEAIKKADNATKENPELNEYHDGLSVSQMLLAKTYEENSEDRNKRYTKALDNAIIAIKTDPNESNIDGKNKNEHQRAFARIKKGIDALEEKHKTEELKVEHKKEQPAKEKKA